MIPHQPLIGIDKNSNKNCFFPPCGILPIQSFASYIGPLSYLSENVQFDLEHRYLLHF